MGGPNASYHHNLIAHHSSRNPRFASGCGNTDFRNNVVYNWGYNSVYGGEKVQKNSTFKFSAINMVANYYKQGPGTLRGSVQYRIVQPSSRNGLADYGKWYVTDNYVYGHPNVTADNWNGGVQAGNNNQAIKLDVPAPFIPIEQQTAEEAYQLVLENAGTILPRRDILDKRVIQEVTDGTATYGKGTYNKSNGLGTKPSGIIDSQKDVGGWPELKSTTAPTDTDHDGMPDSWETANGLNPDDPEDRNGIGEGGYTNLEIYLNSRTDITDVESTKETAPNEFVLAQNYPNPFNPSTTIKYKLKTKSEVKLYIYNVIGREIKTLVNQQQTAGEHSVTFDASNLASGIYIYRLKIGSFEQSRKMLLLK